MMARALAANGAKRVYLLGRRPDVLIEAVKHNPAILVAITCDVTNKESLQKVVDKITYDVGYINLFVANSGVLGPPNKWDTSMPLSEVRKNLFTNFQMEEMTSALNANVTGAFFSMVAFLELLEAGNKNAVEKGGFGKPDKEGSNVPSVQSQIIVTASIAGYSRKTVSTPAYGSSKAAMIYLTKQASSALAPYGIRANALAPGCKFLSLRRYQCMDANEMQCSRLSLRPDLSVAVIPGASLSTVSTSFLPGSSVGRRRWLVRSCIWRVALAASAMV